MSWTPAPPLPASCAPPSRSWEAPVPPEARLEPCMQEEEQRGEPSGSPDPRSPTPGVSRTPLKTSVAEGLGSLAKQLTDMFISPERGTQGDDGSPVGVEATDQLLGLRGRGGGDGRRGRRSPCPARPRRPGRHRGAEAHQESGAQRSSAALEPGEEDPAGQTTAGVGQGPLPPAAPQGRQLPNVLAGQETGEGNSASLRQPR
ncbi:cell division cycle-associated protein 3 [Hemitrygon akajei]|uniref:cell division cycle-associated protein 3 n=1 Tax=Hemitrygon akajei TaxID=2704970 RepID=UPI003BFA1F67